MAAEVAHGSCTDVPPRASKRDQALGPGTKAACGLPFYGLCIAPELQRAGGKGVKSARQGLACGAFGAEGQDTGMRTGGEGTLKALWKGAKKPQQGSLLRPASHMRGQKRGVYFTVNMTLRGSP
jgi:hypothetical protein